MKLFKYGCAILALVYLVYALLPPHFIVDQHSRAEAIAPEWFGRTLSIVYFLLFGVMFYGAQKRKPIYWRLIPALLGVLLLCFLIPALWSLIQLSQPLVPFMFVIVVVFIAFLVFIAWWRNQKNYFV